MKSHTPSTAKKRNTWLRLKAIVGLDMHIFHTVLFRSWGILAGAITLVLLPLWLSPVQQGYYYTFASLLALQVFFELGLGQVIIQVVGHEAAHLAFHENGTISGTPEKLSRLAEIVALLRHWYAIAAVLFLIFGGLAGIIFFGHQENALPIQQWGPIWGCAVTLTAINLYFSPQLAIIEGGGLVGQVARLRLHQSMFGYGLLWVLLISGANLWAAIAVPFAAAFGTPLWLHARKNWLTLPKSNKSLICWRRDIFPMQWRIAISWISGYFMLNLFIPLLFKQIGPADAGKLGLTMTIFNAISTIGMSWVNAKASKFSILIAQKDSQALLVLFIGVAWRSLCITTLLATIFITIATVCALIGLPLMHRIASIPVMVCLAWVSIVNSITFSSAVFMRAHKEEPMLTVSVVGGAITALAAWAFSKYGATSMMLSYALVATFISLPWTLLILRRYLARHGGDSRLFFRPGSHSRL